ncbi:hypothetical protein NDU88_005882 [Pleurodeles waltl]|uniref:Uncharacterized protein n=1 Tax=Pleurodeles waltl TaxID=8319 RepID=A0AAV7SMW5_PLEWA|nr:hypothetical protein NDU88_005882 [Pleurodeles waltl]
MRTRLTFYESVEARRCGCACSSSRVAEKPFKGLARREPTGRQNRTIGSDILDPNRRLTLRAYERWLSRGETAGTQQPDYLRSSCRRDDTILSQNTGSPLLGLLRFSHHREFSAVHHRSGQTLPGVRISEKTLKGKENLWVLGWW